MGMAKKKWMEQQEMEAERREQEEKREELEEEHEDLHALINSKEFSNVSDTEQDRIIARSLELNQILYPESIPENRQMMMITNTGNLKGISETRKFYTTLRKTPLF